MNVFIPWSVPSAYSMPASSATRDVERTRRFPLTLRFVVLRRRRVDKCLILCTQRGQRRVATHQADLLTSGRGA